MLSDKLLILFKEQFVRLRDGDRFWYQSYLPKEMVPLIEKRTLSDIIIDDSIDNYSQFP